MPELTEAELKKHLEKRQFSRVYLLYGEEKYLVKKYAEKLMLRAGAENFADFNFQKFDGAEAGVDAIADAAEALPFMAEQKCVAVSDFNADARNAAELSKLNELLENLPESCVLVFYMPSLFFDVRKSAKWKKLLAAFQKYGCTVELKKRDNATLEKLLCTAAEKRGCTLSRRDAARIIDYSGSDLQTLFNELEKLCAFTGQGEITAAAIEKLVAKNMETTVFLLSKAILSGEYDRAYSILDLLFYQNEEPVSVLAVLSSAYLDMYRVRTSVQSGLPTMEPAEHFDYKRKEFRLKNAERDSRRLSTAMLRQSLDVLLQADIALKSARGDRRIVMEKLIAQLLLIAEKEKLA